MSNPYEPPQADVRLRDVEDPASIRLLRRRRAFAVTVGFIALPAAVVALVAVLNALYWRSVERPEWHIAFVGAAGLALVVVGVFGLLGTPWTPYGAALLALLWFVRIAYVWHEAPSSDAARVFSTDTLRFILAVQSLPGLAILLIAACAALTELQLRRGPRRHIQP